MKKKKKPDPVAEQMQRDMKEWDSLDEAFGEKQLPGYPPGYFPYRLSDRPNREPQIHTAQEADIHNRERARNNWSGRWTRDDTIPFDPSLRPLCLEPSLQAEAAMRKKKQGTKPTSKVKYFGDLKDPPFDGEIKPANHIDWTTLKLSSRIGANELVFFARKDGTAAVGRIESEEKLDDGRIAAVVQLQSGDSAVRLDKARLFVRDRFQPPDEVFSLPEVEGGKRTPFHEWVRKAEQKWSQRVAKAQEEARRLAKPGDYWFFAYIGDGASARRFLNSVPGCTAVAALKAAATIWKDVTGVFSVELVGSPGVWDGKRCVSTDTLPEPTSATSEPKKK